MAERAPVIIWGGSWSRQWMGRVRCWLEQDASFPLFRDARRGCHARSTSTITITDSSFLLFSFLFLLVQIRRPVLRWRWARTVLRCSNRSRFSLFRFPSILFLLLLLLLVTVTFFCSGAKLELLLLRGDSGGGLRYLVASSFLVSTLLSSPSSQ